MRKCYGITTINDLFAKKIIKYLSNLKTGRVLDLLALDIIFLFCSTHTLRLHLWNGSTNLLT
jgi:hypothetical protein